ncbi:histidine phosphatase family protein [Streptomyces sp. NPDC006553]|uniref:SixA phosphatase family protein n=1 Tax=unclassified Streptomyces TaxID=2593676 RepID=UPI0022581FE5|nr:histidine phosphatase family protein [Streptomyces sp. NBC_00233]MCX5231170.1 histidine phosphatase family protein [Streptomyces sp. NBC_00233]
MQPSTEHPEHDRSADARPRRLLVLRHAKSAWPEGVADQDRPLGPRGLRDAPAVGRFLAEAGGLPDLVLCSPARRARHTWELAAAELDNAVPTRHDPRLYGADAPELLDVLHGVSDQVATLLLVGHNPGLQELVLLLADGAAGAVGTGGDVLERVRTKFPTSAIAFLTWYGTWTDLRPGEVLLTDLAIPRGVRDPS